MKKKSPSTKELYKNFIFLVASGIVLVAATVAWFGQNSSSSASPIGASVQAYNPIQIDYYISAEDYETMASHDGDSSDISLQDRQSTTWSPSFSSIDISSIYPGQFFSYKMVVTNSTKNLSLKFDSVYCAASDPPTPSANETDTALLLSAIKLDALATVRQPPGSETLNISLVSTDLSALSSNATVLTTTGPASSGDIVTFYFDIFLPGGDSSIDYEAFRESGAVISISQVMAE